MSLAGSVRVRHGKYGMGVTGESPMVCLPEESLIPLRSCFNAFSRVDVRVDVKIPGGVNHAVLYTNVLFRHSVITTLAIRAASDLRHVTIIEMSAWRGVLLERSL